MNDNANETNSEQPQISAVKAASGRTVIVTWKDGTDHTIDISGLLDVAAMAPLDDDAMFQAVQVGEWGWCLHWSDDAEISSDTLWRLALAQDSARFRSWRKGHGMRQPDAAAELGISVRTIKNYESGEYPIPKTVKLALIGYDTLKFQKPAA